MLLENLYQLIDDLSVEDLDALSRYIDQQREHRRLAQYTEEERIHGIEKALADLRQGLDADMLTQLTDAMNREWIEPFDESEWRD